MMVASGMADDLVLLPPHRFTNLLYHLVMRNRDEKDRGKAQADLDLPLPGETEVEEGVWAATSMGSAFEQLLAEHGD
jgi:hypothetical protein